MTPVTFPTPTLPAYLLQPLCPSTRTFSKAERGRKGELEGSSTPGPGGCQLHSHVPPSFPQQQHWGCGQGHRR